MLVGVLGTISAANAFTGPYEMYYCTEGNPFRSGLSRKNSFQVIGNTDRKQDVVKGVFEGKRFEFAASPRFNKADRVLTWTDVNNGLSVSVELPGPYDGIQDAFWGQIRIHGIAKALSCFRGAR